METVEQGFICPACGHKNPASAKFCQNDGYPLRDGDPEDPLVGRLVGNYRLLQRKGEGGFGVVYLAEHNNLKTKYAVKILHPQFSANRHIAERFRREALAAGKMRHEHVVSIADFDQAQGIGYYYVMEYLEGKTLKSVLDEGEEFSPERILHVARQVTSAMERVHSLNIVHRDLKPENIFLVEEGGVPDYVKLVDFGIAKIMGEEGASLTRTGLSVGTPLYMSPEQARGNLKGLDHRTDIYSWGIILFEMLTYRPPFFSENPHEVVMMQIRELPPRLFEVCVDRQFSQELESLLQRVLAKNPEERPSSMKALYAELEEILSAPDAILETGMTQVVERREEWVAASQASLSTPTATSTREILESESRQSLETTGEQLLDDPGSTTDEGHQEDTIRGANVVDDDTPDWRAVFQKGELEGSDLLDTLSSKDPSSASGDPSQTASQPSVDVHFVSGDENPLPPSSELFESYENLEELTGNSDELSQVDPQMLPPPQALNEVEVQEELAASLPSFSTNPDALRSPQQRFGAIAAVVVLACLLLGLLLWNRKPVEDTKIDYQSLLRKAGKKNAKTPKDLKRRAKPSLARKKIAPGASRLKPDAAVAPKKKAEPIVIPALKPLVPRRVAPRPRVVPQRAVPKVTRVRLTIQPTPRSALCSYREGRERWREMDNCRLKVEVGESVEIRIRKRGYYSQRKSWLPKKDDSWYIRLRRRVRRRARSRTAPRRRRKRVRVAPPRRRPAARGDSIFEQAPNPFADKKKK